MNRQNSILHNRRIGVLLGGLSSEQAVSVQTGEAVVSALQSRGYRAEPVFVDRDLDLVLRQNGIDLAFLAVHGKYGEDGCIQGMLELLGIPYTGSDVLASALAMHKVRAKQLFRLHNLPTPAYYTWDRSLGEEIVLAHGEFGFPAVVKPVAEGSSVGISIVHNADELARANEEALRFDREIMVERFVGGKEISVAVLGDRALGAVEIETASGFYDYAAKYSRGDVSYYIPPRLSPERYRGALALAARAHRALGCSGATRVDMVVSDSGNEYILEVNTLPGLTPTSLLPKIAHSVGLSFEDLCEGILTSARLAGEGRRDGDRRVASRAFLGPDRRTDESANPH